MRAIAISVAVLCLAHATGLARAQQTQNYGDSYYQITGLVYLREFDPTTRTLTSTSKVPRAGLRFYIVGKYRLKGDAPTRVPPPSTPPPPPAQPSGDGTGGAETPPPASVDATVVLPPRGGGGADPGDVYLLIRFYNIDSEPAELTRSALYVNKNDNGRVFALRADEFSTYEDDGYIRLLHKRGINNLSFTYGGVFSVPFKFRPKVGTENRRINPELTLGGYVGPRMRLGAVRPYYLSLVATAGLAALPVTDDNNGDDAMSKGDATVLGLTASVGLVAELDDFQIGIAAGVDYASGNYASEWIYDGEPWYSFSIGYSFFGKKDDQKPDAVSR